MDGRGGGRRRSRVRRRVRAWRAVAVLTAVATVAAACTRPDDQAEEGVATGGATSTEGEAPSGDPDSRLDQAGFGDLEAVCGEAEAGSAEGGGTAAEEVGLTADEVRLGTITDKGSAERPGLTQEMYDAAVAFAGWCNEHGGIQGREVVIDDLDARLFEHGQRVAEACEQDFALVGGGGVFDSQGLDDRIACDLPSIPAYTVSPQARVADLQVQPVPNPVHEFAAAGYRWVLEEDDGATNFGILWVNLEGPATIHDQVVDGVEQLGYDVVFDEQYRPIGETGWRGFVQQMRDAGVETFEIVGEPENLTALQSAMQTEGWYPDYTILQPNYIDQKYAEEGGPTVSESTYMRSAIPTFDMADEVPAMADYLELMERYNPEGRVAMLGVQALSAFLLFATAANGCGADLSRACLLDQAAAAEGWTAGGLHSPQTPGNAVSTRCSLLVQATPDGFVTANDIAQPNEGIYNCDEDNVIELNDDYGVAPPEA